VNIDGEFVYDLRADGLIVANAHGIDRLRAFVGRADTATERARVRVGADLPAYAVPTGPSWSATAR